MKILLLNNLYEPYTLGGGGRSVKVLARAFYQRGHNPLVVTLHPQDEHSVEVRDGVTVHYLPLKNIDWPFSDRGHRRFCRPIFNLIDLYNPFMGSQVAEILDRVQPDIIYTKNLYGFSTAVWKTISTRDIPVVHTLGDYYLICLHATLTRNGDVCQSQCVDCRAWTVNQKHMTHYVDAVIGVSDFVLRKHQEFGFFQQTTTSKVIYPPVEWDGAVSAVDLSPGDEPLLRVGYIGRLTEEKGVMDFLEATETFSRDELDVHVAGEGSESFIEALSPKLNRPNVTYHGFMEPNEFFQHIDLLVVPSRMPETFGRVVFEGFGYGRPVIASRIGALKELVTERENGLLFEPGGVDQLRESLEDCVSTPQEVEKMGEHAKQTVDYHGTSETVNKHLRLFEELLGDPE